MSIQQLKEEHGIYFDTFWFIQKYFDHNTEWFCNGDEVSEHGYESFLNYVESLKRFEKYKIEKRKKINMPFFSIVNGKAKCPLCGSRVYRSPEIMLPRHPIFTYYCKDCKYSITSHLVPEGITMDKELVEEMRKDAEEQAAKQNL